MALALYRRHRKECKAGHRHNLRTSEYDERKKGWKRCECPIFVSGSLAQIFKRYNTGHWEWEDARVVATRFDVAGRWNSHVSEPAKPSPTHERTRIADALDAFLAKCKSRDIQPATYAKYQTFTKQLAAYSNENGYLSLDQLTVTDMDRFYGGWRDGIRGKAKKLERLKSFVKFCQKRKWLADDITEDLQAPEGSSVTVPKSPYSDEELERIYAVCDKFGAPTKLGPGNRNWTGEDVKDFVYLSVYTGLRISDVAMFDITKRLKGNDVFLRMHKTKRPLFTWIPDWLVQRLRARQKVHARESRRRHRGIDFNELPNTRPTPDWLQQESRNGFERHTTTKATSF
jgi:hypothetical protein